MEIKLTEENTKLLNTVVSELKKIGVKTDTASVVNFILHFKRTEIQSAVSNISLPSIVSFPRHPLGSKNYTGGTF